MMYLLTPDCNSIRSAPLRIAPNRKEEAIIPNGSLRASKAMPMLSQPYPLEKNSGRQRQEDTPNTSSVPAKPASAPEIPMAVTILRVIFTPA